MAARTRTVTEMIADVRYRCNLEAEVARHPDANIQRLINESWQAVREIVSEVSPYYLKAKSGTLTAGAVIPDASGNATLTAAFGKLDLPADCVRVYGLDLEVGGQLIELEPLPFEARNDYQSVSQRTNVPEAFFVYNMGAESTTTVTAGALALFPAPNIAYPYTLWYLPIWADISTTSVFDAFSGLEQWVLWDVCAKTCARDNDRQGTYGIAVQERMVAEARIKSASKTQRAGPLRVQDTRGRRANRRFRRYDPWSVP